MTESDLLEGLKGYTKRLEKALEGKALTRVAEAAGIGTATFYNSFKKGGKPQADTVVKIAFATGVDPLWLLYGIEGPFEISGDIPNVNDQSGAPKEQPESKTSFKAAFYSQPTLTADVPNFLIPSDQDDSDLEFLKDLLLEFVSSDALAPTLTSQTVALIDTRHKSVRKEGIYCFDFGDKEVGYRRCKALLSGSIEVSDNQGTETVADPEALNKMVVGRVVGCFSKLT